MKLHPINLKLTPRQIKRIKNVTLNMRGNGLVSQRRPIVLSIPHQNMTGDNRLMLEKKVINKRDRNLKKGMGMRIKLTPEHFKIMEGKGLLSAFTKPLLGVVKTAGPPLIEKIATGDIFTEGKQDHLQFNRNLLGRCVQCGGVCGKKKRVL